MCHSPTRPVLCSIFQDLHLPFQLSEGIKFQTGLPSETIRNYNNKTYRFFHFKEPGTKNIYKEFAQTSNLVHAEATLPLTN